MLRVTVVDAELELIPEKMWEDHRVRKYSKERGKHPSKILLDSNYLHSAVETYFPGMGNRMGRPDIFHILINVVQDSIENRLGEIEFYIHTKQDIIIEVNREMRPPKSYNRFTGLFEKLFEKGYIDAPDGEILMKTKKGGWRDAVNPNYKTIIMHPDGEKTRVSQIFSDENEHYNLIIGGFSEGDYQSDIKGKMYSIFHKELTIWTVAAHSIAGYGFFKKNL
ncbi:16S rRNA methyltransferase [Caldiplasma sukawensis]